MIPDTITDTDLRDDEAVCPVHNLTFFKRLPACPECREEQR